MTSLSFPLGPYVPEESLTPARRAELIGQISDAPTRLRAAVDRLTDEQLDTRYRPDGWTVRQLAHHVPDSHLNAYIRFKLALTEVNPTIKPYDEARWAELPDTAGTSVAVSLVLLEALHRRWVVLLRAMTDAEWSRTFFHPEKQQSLSLDWFLGLYAWHGRHHVAHITGLRERMGWG